MEIAANVSAGIQIGDVEKVVGNAVDKLSHKPKPLYLPRSAAVIGAGSIAVLDLGSPPVGSVWQVRCITLYGADDHTVLASTVFAVYTGDSLNAGLHSLRIPGLAIPSVTFIPDTGFMVHANESLFIQSSTSIAAGQQVGCNILLEEWKEHEISRSSGR